MAAVQGWLCNTSLFFSRGQENRSTIGTSPFDLVGSTFSIGNAVRVDLFICIHIYIQVGAAAYYDH